MSALTLISHEITPDDAPEPPPLHPVDEWFLRQQPGANMREVCIEVAEISGFTVDELRGPGRKREIAHARMYAYHRCRRLGFSHEQIGRFFGGRDPSTICSGIRRVEQLAGEQGGTDAG